jgi:hypothetical protein
MNRNVPFSLQFFLELKETFLFVSISIWSKRICSNSISKRNWKNEYFMYSFRYRWHCYIRVDSDRGCRICDIGSTSSTFTWTVQEPVHEIDMNVDMSINMNMWIYIYMYVIVNKWVCSHQWWALKRWKYRFTFNAILFSLKVS